jgi:small subunit ribosomal protein S20
MANHQSSEKRIRQDEARKLNNKYYAKSTRNALKELRATTDKAAALKLLPKVSSMLDRLAKKAIIHRNKAANLKSEIAKQVKRMA